MALVLKDRVKETTTTTGTGTYTLAGAETGFEAFSSIGNSNTTYYCCTDGVDFEIGIGTYTLSGTTLARTTILQSSNSDAAFSWANGRRTIFCTQPAEKAVFLDANGNLPITSSSSVGGSLAVTGAVTVGGTLGVTGATTIGGLVTANAKIDLNGTELILDADADTSITADTDDQIDIRVAGTDQLTIKDGAISPVTDSDIDLGTTSLRYKDAFIDTVTTTGNVVVGGDLTITGDDLVMGTNTAGHLLIADGTNFNPTAVGSLTEIGTVANDDVFLAVDTSGGGLKKVTRSTIVSGLAIGGVALSNVIEDTTPQLGGNLDMNGKDIVTTSNATLDLAPNGTGTVVVRGNSNSGAIVFNCESNSHGQTVQAQPHSASATNTMLLPEGANSTLVSLVSADTLTNKTLTTPTLTGTSVVASLDISGDIDVDGTTNLDVVDIDGAVNMATTALVTGVLTTTAATVFNGGFASNADSTMGTDKKIIFRDAAIHISSTADGDLSIAADDEIDLTSTLIDINGNVEISGTSTLTGNVTLGAQLIMPDVTSTKMLVADGTSYQEVSVSGDVTIANNGAVTIANNAVTLAKLAGIARGKFIVGDASGNPSVIGPGTNGQILTSDGTDIAFAASSAASLDDATALAIALG